MGAGVNIRKNGNAMNHLILLVIPELLFNPQIINAITEGGMNIAK